MTRFVLVIGAILAGGVSSWAADQTQPADLARQYRATLDFSNQPRGYDWTCGPRDVWRLKQFAYALEDGFSVKLGPSQVVFGCHDANVVWAAVFPDKPGRLLDASPGEGEHVASVWMRFNPARLGELFPEKTIAGRGDASLLSKAKRLAAHKMTACWQSGGRPMIPMKKSIIFDMDTREGPRRFYAIDTETGNVQYVDAFRTRPMPAAKPLNSKVALSVFDNVWDAFDR